MDKNTIKFVVPDDPAGEMKAILNSVYSSLSEKGYNPINQIVGYLLSEDPTYITNYNNARSLIEPKHDPNTGGSESAACFGVSKIEGGYYGRRKKRSDL